MANAHERYEADEERFERLNERGDAEREERREAAEPLLHDHPHYSFRTDERCFPCGLDSSTPGARIAWHCPDDINCPGCLAAREAARLSMAESTARNAEWLAAQSLGDGYRFRVGPDGELVDTYGEWVKS